MSYDLDFIVKGKLPPRSKFLEYFEGRENYEIEGDTAHYATETSGIEFRFTYEAQGERKGGGLWASFYINHVRPRYFARWASYEIASFIEEFKVGIEDPQPEGLGHGPFDKDEFVKAWEESQYAFIRQLHEEGQLKLFTVLPSKTLEEIYFWNIVSPLRNLSPNGHLFTEMFLIHTVDGPKTTFLWPDQSPIVFPEVETALIMRVESRDNILIPFNELPAEALKLLDKEQPTPCCSVVFDKPPAWVKKLFSFPSQQANCKSVDYHRVLDLELVEAALGEKYTPPPPKDPSKIIKTANPGLDFAIAEGEMEDEAAEAKPARPGPANRPQTRSTGLRPPARSGTKPGARSGVRSATGRLRRPAPKKSSIWATLGIGCGVLILLVVGGVFALGYWAKGKVDAILLTSGRMTIQAQADYDKHKKYYDTAMDKHHAAAFQASYKSKSPDLDERQRIYLGELAELIRAQAKTDGEKEVEASMMALKVRMGGK